MARSLTTLLWLVLVLGVLIYAFAVLFVTEVQHDEFEDAGDDAYADLFTAMKTLSSVVVIYNWTETLPKAQTYLLAPFFFFALFGALGMTKLIISAIVDSLTAYKQRLEWETKYRQLAHLSSLWETEMTRRHLTKEDIAHLQGEARKKKLEERKAEMLDIFH